MNMKEEPKMENEMINGESRKSNKLVDRFNREIHRALRQIEYSDTPICSVHDYEVVKMNAVVDDLCKRLVDIVDDQIARALFNFDFGVGVSVRKPNI